MTNLQHSTQETLVNRVLDIVSKTHGVAISDMLDEGNKISRTEIQRAKHHFRYLISIKVGLRESARLLGCAPATIFYARKTHQRKYKVDFYYTELFDQISKKLS